MSLLGSVNLQISLTVLTMTTNTVGLSGVVNNYNLHLDYVLPLNVVKSFSTSSPCLIGSITNNNLNLSFILPTNVVQTFNTTTPGMVGIINNNVLTLNYTNTSVTSFSSSQNDLVFLPK